MRGNHYKSDRQKLTFSLKFQIIIWGVATIVVLWLMLLNTSSLRSRMDDTAHTYVEDVAYQLSSDIAAQLQNKLLVLDVLGDSVTRMSQERLSDFLIRKADIVGFEHLFVVYPDGSTIPSAQEHPEAAPGIGDSFAGKKLVTKMGEQRLLFSAPAYEDGEIVAVVAGITDQQSMQELIRPKSFSGLGLSCIVSSKGEVIIAPTDTKPFESLDEIFNEEQKSGAIGDICQMRQDLADMKSGVFHFTAVDNTHLILSYHVIGVSDWFLLTLVPGELIMEQIDQYSISTYIIVGLLITVFITIFLIAFQIYQKNSEFLEKLAFVDPLTGGMNQQAFQLSCQKLVRSASPGTYTVVFLNVKNFKLVNERFGFEVGDRLLQYVYQEIRSCISDGELVAKGALDRFFLCLKEHEPEQIQKRLDKMLEAINDYVHSADINYKLLLKQGACIVTDPGLDIGIIQDRARTAGQNARNTESCHFYSDEMMLQIKKEQMINELFDTSINDHDFQVFLQPKIHLGRGAIEGAEALVRWVHPEKGMIFPSDFIPVLEKSENICKLDLYVFEEVCVLLKKWQAEGRQLYPVSVNLSRMHFSNLHFLEEYAQLKKKYEIPDGIIELEMTESIFFNENQREIVKYAIRQMHSYGFLCSLDDFGVGYSSLALLQEFDIDTIKLDRQFFLHMEDEKARRIINGLIMLSKSLRLTVVAEGIETDEQVQYLKGIDCDLIQGYVFSRPLSIADYEKWSRNWKNHTSF